MAHLTYKKESPGTRKLRVAVMGAGAVGSYLGGILACSGNHVTLIARGEHLHAIRDRGLQVYSQHGDFVVRIEAADNPADVGPVDLVLFTVKTYHNEDAIPLMLPLIGGDTRILTLQNGVESWEQLQSYVGIDCVLPGAIYIEVKRETPGVVCQLGSVYRMVFGEPNGGLTTSTVEIREMFVAAGMPTEISDVIIKALWTKWLFISTLAGVTSASRANLSALLETPQSRQLIVQVMTEIEEIGRKQMVALDEDVVARTFLYMEAEAAALKASMFSDLESGRPLELEALTGAIVRMGRRVGVPTPANEVIYGLLKPHAGGS
ncbi:ketopantoate reductase family protein [Dehalococcoidia bacterium]|nr:ketopantoate reductase family protein [Dehalococcoidia bacterium]